MDKILLNEKALYELRLIARNIGVRHPTSFRKKDLIDKILRIESGIDTPYFGTKGRIPFNTQYLLSNQPSINPEKISKINKILLKAKYEIINLLLDKDS